uniref:3'(2'),5'-bisphosphate nucleotidase CysQ family protein n=1 Tax=Desertifilum tharense IPPAS B-1220 TaxID=1781255 RepID=A0ACD5GQE4_9CYAN
MNILACDRQIQSVLRQCGQQIQSLVLQQFAIEQKGPGDYVTDIDRLLDRQLAAAFQEMFPHDGAITEENARSRKLFHESYSRLWLIDPLDGTEDFIQGEQSYAVMVGLLQDAQPSAGWIYAPATDTLYAGGTGWGCGRFKERMPDNRSRRFLPSVPRSPLQCFWGIKTRRILERRSPKSYQS